MPERKPIDPALRLFLDQQVAASPGPVRSPEDARSRLLSALTSRTGLNLPDVHTEEREIAPGLSARLYKPVCAPDQLPVLVYLHGGGWVAGSVATHDPFCRLLCHKAAISLLAVEYRRAPEHPYPAGVEDTLRAVHWTGANATDWGGDPQRLALGGDSAGANLAAVAANQVLAAGGPPLKGLLLLYPVTDHYNAGHPSYDENSTGYGLEAASMRWYWDQYAPGVSSADPGASPLRLREAGPLPATFIATAEYDVLRDEGLAYAQKLEEAGVRVTRHHAPDMHHDFPVSPATVARFPQCDAALASIADWLRQSLA